METPWPVEGSDPKLSGPAAEPPAVALPALDVDPDDRSLDRVLACMGLLDDAAPMFGPAQSVPGAGVLLAVPAIVESGEPYQVNDFRYVDGLPEIRTHHLRFEALDEDLGRYATRRETYRKYHHPLYRNLPFHDVLKPNRD